MRQILSMKAVYRSLAVFFSLILLGIYGGRYTARIERPFPAEPPPADTGLTELVLERQGFVTELVRKRHMVDTPVPKRLFSLVYYPTALGNMVAYLSKVPKNGRLHPAVIWINDGLTNSIGDTETGAPFREAGIVMMYPALRGGSGNPGYVESGFGEVDDIVAAADFLAQQPGIDPERIYLGGVGVGATEAMLTAECSSRFRAVFSFNPMIIMNDHQSDEDSLTYSVFDIREIELRTPVKWLRSIRRPVYVLGGAEGYLFHMRWWKEQATGVGEKDLRFYVMPGKDHVSAVEPVCRLLAAAVLRDTTGKKGVFAFEPQLLPLTDK